MQTILGAGGTIGNALATALTKYTNEIRLVSRKPVKVNPTDEIVSANITKAADLDKAVAGSKTVYLTVGFPYNHDSWHRHWKNCMELVIESCIRHECKLVFFDNVYMYDKDHLGNMTEDTAVNPPSKKGKIRAEVADMLLEKMAKNEINALIARSADFYGPGIKKTSLLTEMVFNPLYQERKASWLACRHCKHSFTYTPDAALATALLGNTDSAYGEIWHLPTAPNPYTADEWVATIAKYLKTEANYMVLKKWMVKMIGIFVPLMREIPEMMYQYDRDYVFNSSKFEERFNFKPTPYLEGIKQIIKADYD
jgi:nucleoside-diphosphate-sugar epimerase